MLRLRGSLLSAARDFGRLPELPEAGRLLRAGDAAGALQQLQRASEVVASVPMPGLQAVSAGALAGALRAAGELTREASVWEAAMTYCGDDDAARLHVLHGLTTCCLSRGDANAALQHCEEASARAQSSSDDEWVAVFGIHRSLARVLAASGSQRTAEQLQHDLDERESYAASAHRQQGGKSGEAGAVEMATAAAEGTRLLMGDVIARSSADGPARLTCWYPVAKINPNGDSTVEGAGSKGSEGSAGGEGGEGGEGAECSQDVCKAVLRAETMREVAARCRIGASFARTGEPTEARTHLTAAIDTCEERLPAGHPLLPSCVSALADVMAANGEFISAEGLHRSAIDTLTAGSSPADRGLVAGAAPSSPLPESPASHAVLLVPALLQFANLLERLETNGKPRTAEAQQLRATAMSVREQHPHLLMPEGRVWLGLEPWYTAMCHVDYLEACLE